MATMNATLPRGLEIKAMDDMVDWFEKACPKGKWPKKIHCTREQFDQYLKLCYGIVDIPKNSIVTASFRGIPLIWLTSSSL